MSRLQFEGQRENEKFQFLFRRHLITASRGFAFFLIMAIVGLIPVLLWPNNPHIFWAWFAFALVGLIGAAYSYMLWYFSIYIVTDERIRQVMQKSLFKKTVVDLNFNKIETIAYHVPGFFAGILNYGNIIIQTSVGDVTISMVKNPEKVYNALQNLIGK